MRARSTLVLLAVFLILLGGYFAGNLLERRKESARERDKKLFIVSDPESIDEILAEGGSKYSFTLVREGEQWKIGVYDALPSFVENLFSSIQEARILSVAADSLENMDRYGMGEGRGTELTLKSENKPVFHIKVGFVDTRPQTYYAVRDNDARIYRVEGLHGNLFYDELRSALVERAERDGISSVKIVKGKSVLTVKKNNDVWLVNGRRAKQQSIDDFLNRVSKITADAFPSEGEEFSAPDSLIEIVSQNATATLSVGVREAGKWHTVKNSRGVPYILGQGTYEKIFPEPKFFFE